MTQPGRILGGRYRLLEQLGQGGMGTVWRAEHIELGSLFAVKLIAEDLAESAIVRARFRQEAKAAAALGGDHVVRTFDYGVEGDTPYIVMELLSGESVQDRLKRLGKLAPSQVSELLAQVALALERAHEQGIVHRDLKPGNLFITRGDDGRERIKLLDFGTAKLLYRGEDGDANHTRTGAMVGSPAYMSPEQLRGLREIDPTSDTWALGVVAFECLLGRRPFVAATMADLTMRICSDFPPVPSDLGPVPAGFDDWFQTACAREPSRRFQRAPDMAADFARMLNEAPVDPRAHEVTAVLPSPSGAASAPAPADEAAVKESESTGGIVHSQTVAPALVDKKGRGWALGLGAAVVAVGALAFLIQRAAGTLGAAGVAPVPVRVDARGTLPPTVTPDAAPPADAGAPLPVAPVLRKSPGKPGKQPRGGDKPAAPPASAPTGKTDSVYGF